MKISTLPPSQLLLLFSKIAAEINRQIAIDTYKINNANLFSNLELLERIYESKAGYKATGDREQQIKFLNWVKLQTLKKDFKLTEADRTLICLGVLFQRIFRIESQQNGQLSAAGGQTISQKSESYLSMGLGRIKKSVSKAIATPADKTVLYPILCSLFSVKCFDELNPFVVYEACKAAREFLTQKMPSGKTLYTHSEYYSYDKKEPDDVLKGFNRIVEYTTAGAIKNKHVFYLLMLFDKYSKVLDCAAKRYQDELETLHQSLDTMYAQSPGFTIAEFLQHGGDRLSSQIKNFIRLRCNSLEIKIETEKAHQSFKADMRLMIDNYYIYTSMGMLNYLLNSDLAKEYPQLIGVCIKGLTIDKFPEFNCYDEYDYLTIRAKCQNQIKINIIEKIIPQGTEQSEKKKLVAKYLKIPLTELLNIADKKIDINVFFTKQVINDNLGFSRVHCHFSSLLSMLASRRFYANSLNVAMQIELNSEATSIKAVTKEDKETINRRQTYARSKGHTNMVKNYATSMRTISKYEHDLSHPRIKENNLHLVDKFTKEDAAVLSLQQLYDTHLLNLAKLMPALIEENLPDNELNKRYRLFEKTAIESFIDFINELTGDHEKLIQPFKSMIIALASKHLKEQVKPHLKELDKSDTSSRASSSSSGMFAATSSSPNSVGISGGEILGGVIMDNYSSPRF